MRMIPLLFLLVFVSTCKRPEENTAKHYETKNVIVIVIDGPRYSETWGDSLRTNIPVRDSLLDWGVLVTNFRNNGVTSTNPGHTAICTGTYENIANNGTQLPTNPSIFQHWIKTTGDASSKCCVLASKDKLHVITNCLTPQFHDQYRPYFDCGVNGDGTGGYRSDSITMTKVIDALTLKQPRLMLIAFRGPDYYAHDGDSLGYIQAIRETDQYVGQIWNYIQNDPHYKDKTTVIVTNDHGRHLDGNQNGVYGHGDSCEGCRHTEFFALSPDFKKNVELNLTYETIDISATICELLHFRCYTGKGKVMGGIFQ